MRIEIDFNRIDPKDTKNFYDHIEAVLVDKEEYSTYYVEIDTLEQLEELHRKANLYLTGKEGAIDYSFVMSFDNPVIFLDDRA